MAIDRGRTPLADERTAHATALVVIDMYSDWSFRDGDRLGSAAARIAPAIARLQRRCRAAGIAVVFVNDNDGRWRSDAPGLVARAAAASPCGAAIAAQLAPGEDDHFVLKPKHSAFYETPLDLLLRHLGARRLLLAGVAAEHCIALTAREARMRDYDVVVARDAVAGVAPRTCDGALAGLENDGVAAVRTAARIALAGAGRRPATG